MEREDKEGDDGGESVGPEVQQEMVSLKDEEKQKGSRFGEPELVMVVATGARTRSQEKTSQPILEALVYLAPQLVQ